MVLAPQLTESEDCTPRNWSRRRKRGTRSTTSTRGATTCAMAGLGRTATTYRPATSRPQRESSSQGGASRQECTGASTTRHASAPSSPNSGARPKMAQNFNEIKSHPPPPAHPQTKTEKLTCPAPERRTREAEGLHKWRLGAPKVDIIPTNGCVHRDCRHELPFCRVSHAGGALECRDGAAELPDAARAAGWDPGRTAQRLRPSVSR